MTQDDLAGAAGVPRQTINKRNWRKKSINYSKGKKCNIFRISFNQLCSSDSYGTNWYAGCCKMDWILSIFSCNHLLDLLLYISEKIITSLFVYLIKLHFQVPVMRRGASAFDRPYIFSITIAWLELCIIQRKINEYLAITNGSFVIYNTILVHWVRLFKLQT